MFIIKLTEMKDSILIEEIGKEATKMEKMVAYIAEKEIQKLLMILKMKGSYDRMTIYCWL